MRPSVYKVDGMTTISIRIPITLIEEIRMESAKSGKTISRIILEQYPTWAEHVKEARA